MTGTTRRPRLMGRCSSVRHSRLAQGLFGKPRPPRVKFFWWLVMHGRCWTADRRFRHGLQDSNTCIFCDQAPETLDHLLL